MSEINDLVQRAERYIASAEILINEGDFESSISRVYYAMFYCAEAVLLTKNLTYSSHRGLISAFGEHFVKSGVLQKGMGRELNRAFAKRQLGDYASSFVFSKNEAEELPVKGRDFCNEIIRYLKTNRFF